MKGRPGMAATYGEKLRLLDHDVRLYFASAAVSGFVQDGVRAVLANLYLLRLGYGPEFIGLFGAAGALAFAIFCLPAGTLGERWGNRRLMMTGVSLSMTGSILLPLVEYVPRAIQAEWLLASTVVGGLGLALFFVNGIPFLMSATGAEERNHAFSVQMALVPLASFAGSVVGGILPGVFGVALGVSLEEPAPYRYPLLLAAVLLLPAVVALGRTRELHAEGVRREAVERGPVPLGPIVLIGAIVGLRYAGLGTVLTFFNVYLDAALGASTAMIGALKAVGQLLAAPAALAMPLMVVRWGRRPTIFWGTWGQALGLSLVALVGHWSAAGLGFIGAFGMFSITTAVLRIYSQELVSQGWRGTMSGALMMGAGLSVTAASFGGGHVITALGYNCLFWIGTGLTAAGALLFGLYFGVGGRRKQEEHKGARSFQRKVGKDAKRCQEDLIVERSNDEDTNR